MIWSSSAAGWAAWQRRRWPAAGGSGWPCSSRTPSSAAAPAISPEGPYTFDAGATALMGLGPGEPIGELLARIGVDFEACRTPRYRVHLPDRTLDIGPDARAFEAASAAAFPGKDMRPSALLEAPGGRRDQALPGRRTESLGCRSDRSATWPTTSRILGPGGLLAASTWCLTVLDVLRLLGLDRDVPFRSLVAMLLQDTAQAGPETVPFANAAACLQAYRLGMSRPARRDAGPGRRDRPALRRAEAATSGPRPSSTGSSRSKAAGSS